MKQGRSGQSTAEYAVLIAVVIAAAVGMQTFVKRGLQARYKVASDRFTKANGTIGGITVRSTVDQYEPYYAFQDSGVQQDRTQTEGFAGDGTVQRTVTQDVTKRGLAVTIGTTGNAVREELTRKADGSEGQPNDDIWDAFRQ